MDWIYFKFQETAVYTRDGDDVAVSYAVGMVMHHIRYDYTCVIYGWDSKCAADADWRIQMHVNTLPRQDDQPFYNVLVSDGSTRYAAEGKIKMSVRFELSCVIKGCICHAVVSNQVNPVLLMWFKQKYGIICVYEN